MSITNGFVDKSGAPALKIKIAGALSTITPTEFDAVIDTGFSGFVSMPLISAFPLGLPLTGSTTVELADGSVSSKLTALCTAYIDHDGQSGIVILEPNSTEILIGMDFLRTFKKVLLVHPNRAIVSLVDEAFIDELTAQSRQQATSTAISPPTQSTTDDAGKTQEPAPQTEQ